MDAAATDLETSEGRHRLRAVGSARRFAENGFQFDR
jgi:hypothetical protein